MGRTTNITLTQQQLKKHIYYNPITGQFTWILPTSNRVKKGRPATYISQGYYFIRLFGQLIAVHRLAFLYMTGKIPAEVDHINGNRTDNRWENLRSVTRKENTKNKRMLNSNTSGITGVYWDKNRNKWSAKLKHNGQTINLGRFSTKEEAAYVRIKAEQEFGFHSNHGRR